MSKRPQNYSFIDWVQLHERAWGEKSYTDKPTLEEIMRAPVVTFWRPLKDKKQLYIARLYNDTREIEHYFTSILFRAGIADPEYKLSRIFVYRKPHVIQAVKILIKPLPE